jgi:hypothetical protein
MSGPTDHEALLSRWTDWVDRLVGSPNPQLAEAAQAAVDAIEAGLSDKAAALAARVRVRAWYPGDDQLLAAERYRISTVAGELESLTPRETLSEAALEELRRIYAEKQRAVEAIYTAWAAQMPAEVPATPVDPAAAYGAPTAEAVATATAPAAVPTVSLREFVAEHGILLLSYLGAFLLVVATLLFEIYGTTGNDGGTRFGGVLALDIVFGIAGFICFSRPTLRFVGRSYIAISALMTPLVFAAAYVFLLKSQGLDINLAVFATGVACIVLYGALSIRLESRGYAVMTLVAAPVALVGLFNLLGARAWEGQLLTVLPITMAAIPGWRSERWARLYEPLRLRAIYAYGGLATAWTLLTPSVYADSHTLTFRHLTAGAVGLTIAYTLLAIRNPRPRFTQVALAEIGVSWIGVTLSLDLGGWTGPMIAAAVFGYAVIAGRPGLQRGLGMAPAWIEAHLHAMALLALAAALITTPANGWPVTLTLALVTAAHALRAYLGKPGLSWTVAIGLTLTVINLVTTLDVVSDVRNLDYAAALLALGALYAAAAWRLPRLGLGTFFRAGAIVQLLAVVAVPISSDGLHALLLVVATAVIVMVALDAGEPLWLYAGTITFTVGWYFIVRTLVPPPPNAGADTLILVYSPLPVVYGLLGLGLRRVAGRGWSLPVLVAAAVIAVAVVAAWTGERNYPDAGRALLVYAVLAYVVGVVDGREALVWPAAGGAALGLLLLMIGAGAAHALYPAVFLAGAWLVFLGGFAWDSTSTKWRDAHRHAGLGIAAVTALSCFAVPDFFHAGDIGAVSALVALWGAAAMTALDGRAFGLAVTDYAAALLVAAGAFWISSYAGVENPQSWAAPIGTTLVAAGVAMPRDPRMARYQDNARLVLGLGLALLLGITTIQMLDEDRLAGNYVVVMLMESVAAIVAGIAFRSRVLVLGGSAGAALGALRALLIVSHLLPLYVVFGGVALLLLAISAVLAAMREQVTAVRSDMSHAWGAWEL